MSSPTKGDSSPSRKSPSLGQKSPDSKPMSPATKARLAGASPTRSPKSGAFGGKDASGRPQIHIGQPFTEGQAMTYMQVALKEFEDEISEMISRNPENFPEYSDPLNYKPIEQSIEEWAGVPEVAVTNLMHIQHHHSCVVRYLSQLNEDETTAQLRHSMEERIDVSNIFLI